MTYHLQFIKNSRIFTKFLNLLKFVFACRSNQISFEITQHCKKIMNKICAADYSEATVEWEEWAVEV